MKMRGIVAVWVGMKVTIVIVGITLVFFHAYIDSKTAYNAAEPIWFDTIQSEDAIKKALMGAPDSEVDKLNRDGLSGLMVAAQRGLPDRVLLFLSQGAQVNLRAQSSQNHHHNGATALNLACKQGFPADRLNEIVRILIKHNADIRTRDNNNNTPIFNASSFMDPSEFVSVVRYLIMHGADINSTNQDGMRLIDVIISARSIPRLETLVAHFGNLIDMNEKNGKGYKPIEYLAYMGWSDNIPNIEANLKPLDASINAADPNGLNKLMIAIMHNDTKKAQDFIKKGINLNAQTGPQDRQSAVHLAVYFRSIPIIQMLIKAGANCNLKNVFGHTPLHSSLQLPTLSLQTKLFDAVMASKTASINAQDNNGNTILHQLVFDRNEPMLNYVLKKYSKKINFTIINQNYKTPQAVAFDLQTDGGRFASLYDKMGNTIKRYAQ